ncbi:MAG TPA: hypothetical protein PK360_07120 [bacterium]|nr:hypothetical protein [bacterium]
MLDRNHSDKDKTAGESTPDKSTADDYTAQMDRMVANLKKQSELDRQQRLKLTVIWFCIATVISIIMIYLMLTLTSSTFEDAFRFLQR